MAIYQKPTPIVMQVGNSPQIKFMSTSDSLATITAAGYLNNNSFKGSDVSPSDLLLISYDSVSTVPHAGTLGWFTVSVSNGIITLTEQNNSSGATVTLPTTVGYIPIFSNTTGNLVDQISGYSYIIADNLILTGDFQAGQSGTAGTLASFPATALKGYLGLVAAENAADYINIITNASTGQSTTYTMPDPGVTATNYILSDSTTTQDISTGNFSVLAGDIAAGESGSGHKIISYPATALKGSLEFSASDNTGNTTTTLTNAEMGQTTSVVIPDPVASTGYLQISVSPSDPSSNIFVVTTTVTHSALATGGTVTLFPGGGTKIYQILNIFLNGGTGTNFSGGGGDRLGAVSDTVKQYTVIPAGAMGTIINHGWGDIEMPYPTGAVDIMAPTNTGSPIIFSYTGGTTDYTQGSVDITLMLMRIA